MMPPRMSTVRVVPTPRGQASASASTETFAGKLQVTSEKIIAAHGRSAQPRGYLWGVFERWSLPNTLEVGTVDVLTNATVIPASDFEFSFATPASLTAAVTEANTFYTEGNTLATEIASLPSTDYADTALDNALSTIDQWILPDQIQLIADLAYAF